MQTVLLIRLTPLLALRTSLALLARWTHARARSGHQLAPAHVFQHFRARSLARDMQGVGRAEDTVEALRGDERAGGERKRQQHRQLHRKEESKQIEQTVSGKGQTERSPAPIISAQAAGPAQIDRRCDRSMGSATGCRDNAVSFGLLLNDNRAKAQYWQEAENMASIACTVGSARPDRQDALHNV